VPTCINGGTAGQFLRTAGTAAAPSWADATSLLTAGTGITITGTTPATIGLTNQITAGGPVGSATVTPVVTYNALRACWRWLGVVDGSGAGHLLHPGLVEGVPVDLVVLEVDRLAGRGRGHLGQVGPLPTLGLSGAYGVRRSDGEAEKSIR
jgi:hypothetical protein